MFTRITQEEPPLTLRASCAGLGCASFLRAGHGLIGDQRHAVTDGDSDSCDLREQRGAIPIEILTIEQQQNPRRQTTLGLIAVFSLRALACYLVSLQQHGAKPWDMKVGSSRCCSARLESRTATNVN